MPVTLTVCSEPHFYTPLMRILICAQQAPLPPPDGFRLHLEALLQEFTQEHEVRTLAFLSAAQVSDAGSPWDMRLLRLPARRSPQWFGYIGSSLIRSVFLGRPLRVDELAQRMRRPLREELERFRPDVVHVSTGSLASLGRELEQTPAVLAALDAWHLNVDAWAEEARALRKLFLRTEAKRVRRFEAREFIRFPRVVVVTDEDKRALQELHGELDVVTIPNGVDPSKFVSKANGSRVPNRILFTGVMSYAPNVAAAEVLAREILPRVRGHAPGAHLQIVGRRPNAKVRALNELDGVEVTGEVEDIEPFLSAASVYVCPMVSGTGIKNKLLEAMANGVPCVVTPLALQGLTAERGREVAVGESVEELADRAAELLTSPEGAEEMGRAGASYVGRHHSWAAVARSYLSVYEGVIGSGATPREGPEPPSPK